MAGPGPVVNVLEADEDPVTASADFLEQAAALAEPAPAPRASLQRRAVGGVRRVASFAKFW